jgi:hypothetical protein
MLPDMPQDPYLRQTQRRQVRLSLFLLFIPMILFACVAFAVFSRPSSDRQAFSIESTISRANRIIAIDASDQPLYRWVVTTPEDYTVVSDTGAHAQHDPAQISYGTGWTNPNRQRDDTINTNLTDDEWQRIQQWRATWCHEAPSLRPIKSDEAFYTVALRCSGYTATTFHVPKDQMPPDIAMVLRHSSGIPVNT